MTTSLGRRLKLQFDDRNYTRYDQGMAIMSKTASERFVANLAELTQEYGAVSRLAEHMGVTRVHMSRIVHGRSPVDLDDAERIASYFGLTLDEMLSAKKQFREILKKADCKA